MTILRDAHVPDKTSVVLLDVSLILSDRLALCSMGAVSGTFLDASHIAVRTCRTLIMFDCDIGSMIVAVLLFTVQRCNLRIVFIKHLIQRVQDQLGHVVDISRGFGVAILGFFGSHGGEHNAHAKGSCHWLFRLEWRHHLQQFLLIFRAGVICMS